MICAVLKDYPSIMSTNCNAHNIRKRSSKSTGAQSKLAKTRNTTIFQCTGPGRADMRRRYVACNLIHRVFLLFFNNNKKIKKNVFPFNQSNVQYVHLQICTLGFVPRPTMTHFPPLNTNYIGFIASLYSWSLLIFRSNVVIIPVHWARVLLSEKANISLVNQQHDQKQLGTGLPIPSTINHMSFYFVFNVIWRSARRPIKYANEHAFYA